MSLLSSNFLKFKGNVKKFHDFTYSFEKIHVTVTVFVAAQFQCKSQSDYSIDIIMSSWNVHWSLLVIIYFIKMKIPTRHNLEIFTNKYSVQNNIIDTLNNRLQENET